MLYIASLSGTLTELLISEKEEKTPTKNFLNLKLKCALSVIDMWAGALLEAGALADGAWGVWTEGPS